MDAPIEQKSQSSELLEQLRDVSLPEPVSWWPPAPGWWLVAATVLVLAFFLVRFLRKRWLDNHYRTEARELLAALHADWLDASDDRAFASGAHQLLRRVVIHHAGRDHGARLTGRSFVERANLLSTAHLSTETGSLLTDLSYRPNVEFDVEAVREEIEAWLQGLERKRRA